MLIGVDDPKFAVSCACFAIMAIFTCRAEIAHKRAKLHSAVRKTDKRVNFEGVSLLVYRALLALPKVRNEERLSSVS